MQSCDHHVTTMCSHVTTMCSHVTTMCSHVTHPKSEDKHVPKKVHHQIKEGYREVKSRDEGGRGGRSRKEEREERKGRGGRRTAQESTSHTAQQSSHHWPLLSPPLPSPIPLESCWSYSASNAARAVTSSSVLRKEGRSVIRTSKFSWIERYL